MFATKTQQTDSVEILSGRGREIDSRKSSSDLYVGIMTLAHKHTELLLCGACALTTVIINYLLTLKEREKSRLPTAASEQGAGKACAAE